MNNKYLYQIISLGLILTVFNCGQDNKELAVNTSSPITVSVKKATSDNTQKGLTVSGTIQAADNATLSTRVIGYVEKIDVKVGDKVSKGQLLLRINSSDLLAKKAQVKARIIEATAAFENAKKDYERFTSLFENESASQKELDDITAYYNMAKARLQSAQEMKNEVDAQFAYTNIRAPFSGIIASKSVEVGTMANPGMPLLLIESPDSFEVAAKISESAIAGLNNNMETYITISSIEANFKGRIKEISTSSALTGGQFLTIIEILNPNKQLRSGMFASVQIPELTLNETTESGILYVPKKALVYRGQLTGIYTVSQQNTAILRWLRVGKNKGDSLEVLSGLTEGENYILSSEEKLFNGAKLNIQ